MKMIHMKKADVRQDQSAFCLTHVKELNLWQV